MRHGGPSFGRRSPIGIYATPASPTAGGALKARTIPLATTLIGRRGRACQPKRVTKVRYWSSMTNRPCGRLILVNSRNLRPLPSSEKRLLRSPSESKGVTVGRTSVWTLGTLTR